MEWYKLTIFIPVDYKERVKDACFNAGAGKLGNYDSCSFEVLGKGQFRAKPGATPFIGEIDKVTVVDEVRVEMVCEKRYLKEVLSAMREAHPYEEPAYDLLKMETESC
jgi:hypothetical protein